MKPNAGHRLAAGVERSPALTVRVPEACRITGIGRSKLYELIKSGQLKTVKIGAITLIPVAELRTFLGIDTRKPSPQPTRSYNQPAARTAQRQRS
jgi:excisionase family DNA binding protein